MGLFTHEVSDDIAVSATFPETNPFGLVVNGEQNPLNLHLVNSGSRNYTLVSAAASFHDPTNHWRLIKNASALRYNVPLVGGANFSAPFSMHSEFRPQEIGLTVWVNIAESGGKDLVPITACNQTVSVVEPPASWFDPVLLILYLILGAALLGGAYLAYDAFLAPKGKKGSKGVRVKKTVVPAQQEKKVYPDVKPYEEEWIPEQHLKNRASKLKKKEGTSAVPGTEELTSGGEATSGAESGPDGKTRKRKGKKA